MFVLLLFCCLRSNGSNVNKLLADGWQQLIVDNDSAAMQSLGETYEMAFLSNDLPGMANSMLYLGICSYGTSYILGLQYAMKSLELFSRLKKLITLPELKGDPDVSS